MKLFRRCKHVCTVFGGNLEVMKKESEVKIVISCKKKFKKIIMKVIQKLGILNDKKLG